MKFHPIRPADLGDHSDRFWSKVSAPAPAACWEWTGWRRRNGYGGFDLTPRRRLVAHRFAYSDAVGPIPDGLVIDHLCRNRACVNPAHLEPVTQRENLRRGDTAAARTHCPSGHPYAGTNLAIKADGSRRCRECHRAREAARAEARRAA